MDRHSVSAGTNDSDDSLRGKTVRGISWNLAEAFGRYGVTYFVTIYLARLLSPRDYGLIGLGTAFFTIASVIIDGGFKAALVRKKEVSQADYNTVFYTNLAFALAMYAIIWLAAPFIANFYGEPKLAVLMRLLGVTFITNAVTVVQHAKLRREMKFNLAAFITLPAELVSGVAAIALAHRGFGVESLAVKILLSSFITAFLYRALVKWRPGFQFSVDSFKELFGVGAKFTAATIVRALYNDISVIFIGKIFSARTLGHYTFSNRILGMTSHSVTTAVEQVSFSAFSRIQDDTEHMASWYKQTVRSAAALIFPLMALLIVMAEPLIGLFLGEKWLPSAPYLRIFCVSGALAPIRAISNNILMIKDVNLYLKIEYAAALSLFALLFALVPRGVETFLIGHAAHAAIFTLAADFYKARLINCPFLSVLKHVAPVAGAAGIMGAAVYFMAILMGGGESIAKCAVLLITAAIVYCLCLWMFKVDVFTTAVRHIFSRPRRRNLRA